MTSTLVLMIRYLPVVLLFLACSSPTAPSLPIEPATARSTCETEFGRIVEQERHPNWTSTIIDWRPWTSGAEIKTLDVVPRTYPSTVFTGRRYEAVVDAVSCTLHQYTYVLQFNPVLNRLDILSGTRTLLFTKRFP